MSEPLKPEYVNQAYELITGEPPASKLIAGNRLEMAQIAAVAQRLQSDAESHASELERVRRETVALIEEEAEEFGNLAGGEYYATRLFKLANSVRALLNTPETNP